MEHPEQTAKVTITHDQSTGTRLHISDSKGRDVPLESTHEHVANMRPGESLTITAVSDDRWVQAKAERLESERRAAAQEATQETSQDKPAEEAAPTGNVTVDHPDGQAIANAEEVGTESVTIDNGATTETRRRSVGK